MTKYCTTGKKKGNPATVERNGIRKYSKDRIDRSLEDLAILFRAFLSDAACVDSRVLDLALI